MLEEALISFPGCVLVVSHDRYFLNRVCTGILAFEGQGRVVFSEGNYDYYVDKKKRTEAALSRPAPAATAPRSNPAAAPAAPVPVAPAKPKGRKLSFKEQRELEGMEPLIQTTEAEIVKLEAQLASPEFFKTQGARANAVIAALRPLGGTRSPPRPIGLGLRLPDPNPRRQFRLRQVFSGLPSKGGGMIRPC